MIRTLHLLSLSCLLLAAACNAPPPATPPDVTTLHEATPLPDAGTDVSSAGVQIDFVAIDVPHLAVAQLDVTSEADAVPNCICTHDGATVCVGDVQARVPLPFETGQLVSTRRPDNLSFSQRTKPVARLRYDSKSHSVWNASTTSWSPIRLC